MLFKLSDIIKNLIIFWPVSINLIHFVGFFHISLCCSSQANNYLHTCATSAVKIRNSKLLNLLWLKRCSTDPARTIIKNWIEFPKRPSSVRVRTVCGQAMSRNLLYYHYYFNDMKKAILKNCQLYGYIVRADLIISMYYGASNTKPCYSYIEDLFLHSTPDKFMFIYDKKKSIIF